MQSTGKARRCERMGREGRETGGMKADEEERESLGVLMDKVKSGGALSKVAMPEAGTH